MLVSVLLTLTVSRAAVLGGEVALFSLPFEARPVDSVRREVFRQRVAGGHTTSWFAPASVPLEAPQGFIPSRQASVGPLPLPKRRRRR